MSYRECRSLCEMLRALNYNRIVSLQNFAKPNFQLVADILYWLGQKYDPQSDISDDINEEKDRVEFMKSIVGLFAAKARIKLNAKKLYHADADAVPELLKITSVLYKASNSKAVDEEEPTPFTLPAKLSNLKAHKVLSNEICELGAKLYDAMSREPELKKVRMQALNFLEGISGANDGNDQAYIEGCVKRIMEQQEKNMSEMNNYVINMEQEQKVLEEKLRKKSNQLTRNEKRLRDLLVVKPAFMEEYERLEEELGRLHEVYVNKFRNIDYLEFELEKYNKAEEEKLRRAKKKLEQQQKEAELREKKDLLNVDQLQEGAMEPAEERSFTRGNSRKANEGSSHANANLQRNGQPYQGQGQEEQQNQEDQDEDEDSGEEIEDDDDDQDSDF